MSRVAEKPMFSPEDLDTLKSWANSRTIQVRLSERANFVLMAADGVRDQDVAKKFDARPHTVAFWRKRFIESGIDGLYDAPRPGKPPIHDQKELKALILKTLEDPPPKGQAAWDGKAIAETLGISKDKVWEILRNERIHLQRHRSWCVSTDPEFAKKAADIVGLYLDPPQNAVVLSLDEKPSIQAIERPTGYVQTANDQIVRGLKSTYTRHGTLNLFAALQVATGVIKSEITERKRRVEFLDFMDHVVSDYDESQEIHVIMDNYCIHKKCDAWLELHPNVFFHFTPTSASWLNMVEIWFGIMSRKALKGATFNNTESLATAINDFVEVYNSKAEPFVWRKREVKGSQLRNTISNLR
jgi:transposase